MRFRPPILVLGLVLTLTLLGGPLTASAQRIAGVPEAAPASLNNDSRTFGPTASTSYTIHALAFTGFSATENNKLQTLTIPTFRYCTSPCLLGAPVFLPEGALVTGIQLDACDTNNAGNVAASLRRSGVLIGFAATSLAGTPGCTRVDQALAAPETIDNVNNAYSMDVSIDGSDVTTNVRAVRIFYNLQVSTAPATATFTDVPTSHPFFQWIEALHAAGITTGCNASPPLYCPDDPVTRGQMAVFISKALGLQFAP